MRPTAPRAFVVVAVCSVLFVAAGCSPSESIRVSFTVEGMTCGSCSSAITETLNGVEGVTNATADHVAGTASAVIDGPGVTAEQLAAEIEGLGYTVTSTETKALNS